MKQTRTTSRLGIYAGWAVSSLAFHKTRSLLTVVAVALSTLLLVSTVAFQFGYKDSLNRSIQAMGYQILVTGKGCPHEAASLILRGGSIPMYLQQEVYDHLVRQPEVQDATRFFMQSVNAADGRSTQLYVGIDDNFLRLKPGVGFQRGTWFSSEAANEAILGYNVAEYRRLGIGDEIEIQAQKFSIRGVLDKLGTQDDGTIFLPLGVSQALFEKRDRLTGIGVRLKDPAAGAGFIDRLYELPSVQVVRMSQVQSTILNTLNGVSALLIAFGLLCLVVALVGVFNVSLIAFTERVAEMGVLRALGCSGATLFKLVWSESLLISFTGAALGGILSLALQPAAQRAVQATLVFVPSGTEIAITPSVLFGSCLTVVALCLLAGVYPAYKSSVISPMVSMRGV